MEQVRRWPAVAAFDQRTDKLFWRFFCPNGVHALVNFVELFDRIRVIEVKIVWSDHHRWMQLQQFDLFASSRFRGSTIRFTERFSKRLRDHTQDLFQFG